MMGWYFGNTGGGGWWVMAIGMVAFWGLVIFAVVAIFRGLGRSHEPDQESRGPDPLRILDGRFARGEMELEEYHARQDVLRGAGR